MFTRVVGICLCKQSRVQPRSTLVSLCRVNRALPHMVTKHKCMIEIGDIHIFLLSIQKQKIKELDKKAGLRCVSQTFGHVSV